MISPHTLLEVIDIKECNSSLMSVDDLFAKYAPKILPGLPGRKILDGSDTLTFKVGDVDVLTFDVRIKDDYGWTELMSIRKVRVDNPHDWYRVNIAVLDESSDMLNHVELILTGYENIPMVKEDETKRGFHGEMLYDWKYPKCGELVTIHSFLNYTDHRVKTGIVYEGQTGFGRIVSVGRYVPPTTGNRTAVVEILKYGYIIETRSGFYSTYSGIRLNGNPNMK